MYNSQKVETTCSLHMVKCINKFSHFCTNGILIINKKERITDTAKKIDKPLKLYAKWKKFKNKMTQYTIIGNFRK